MTTLILATSGRAANTGPITAVHLTLIAILMAVAVAVICWGAIQKRRRSQGEADAEERQAEMEAAAPAEAKPAMSAPVAPPLADPAPAAASTETIPLTRLKGLGPKAAALLEERGIGDVAALAALSDAAAAATDADLGAFSGRLSKDRWIEQAKLLNAGDTATYETQFGKLG